MPLNRQYLRGSNYTTMINPFVAPTTILYLVEYYYYFCGGIYGLLISSRRGVLDFLSDDAIFRL